MRNIFFLSAGIGVLLTLSACNDDFLDRFPETEIGKENFFNTEEDLKLYIYSLYSFPGDGIYTADGYSTTDNMCNTGSRASDRGLLRSGFESGPGKWVCR